MNKREVSRREFERLFSRNDVQYIPVIITGTFGGFFIIDSINEMIIQDCNNTGRFFIEGIENDNIPYGLVSLVDYTVSNPQRRWTMEEFFENISPEESLEYFVIENWN